MEYGMAHKTQVQLGLIRFVLYFERTKLFWCNANRDDVDIIALH